MIRKLQVAGSLAVVLLSVGCASLNVLKYNTKIEGDDFNAELARNYLYFSESEAKQYDWPDSERFAIKGIKAAKGQDVLPEEPRKWHLTPENRVELTAAREHLMNVLTESNKMSYPRETAKAQFYYDCWMEQQEENWQTKDIAYCKNHFIDSINNIYRINAKIQDALNVKHYHTVYFNFDDSKISPSELAILEQVIKTSAKIPNRKITLSGYADNTGTEKYNHQLSAKRAEEVKKYLVNAGLDQEIFVVQEFGKHMLAVPTPYGVKERLNRRVEIFIHD
ncbi:MAG: OmpA family protein [Alphaproteobacteria bacterium]|nr:OmpA family protein [Alphaproteobacteria bacterium]OJV16049.1 MAG: hypothetical protein BGO27_04300 [Alphaproteobacteria bacterium 33-17]